VKPLFCAMVILAISCFILALCPLNICFAAEQTITIRVGGLMPKDHPHSKALYRLSGIIKERTDGRIKMIYYPHSELGSCVEQISAVRMGTQDMWNGANEQMARLMPMFNVLSPAFAYEGKEAKLAVLNSPFFFMVREELSKRFDLVMLTWNWFRGYRNLMTLKPVKTIDDLKGIKLRTVRSPAKLAAWKKFGASPIPTAAAGIYTGLKEKAIEGCELDLYSIHYSHYDEICKYCTLTQHEPVYASLVINKKLWNSIPKRDREIIFDAVNETSRGIERTWEKEIAKIMDIMRRKQKVTFIPLSPRERSRWLKIGDEVLHELEVTEKWWPQGTVERIRSKDPRFFKPE